MLSLAFFALRFRCDYRNLSPAAYHGDEREKQMITNSKQFWAVGQTVKVGFMSLQVVARVPTPGDYLPDAYVLKSAKGVFYRFVPHNGLVRCYSLDEAIVRTSIKCTTV